MQHVYTLPNMYGLGVLGGGEERWNERLWMEEGEEAGGASYEWKFCASCVCVCVCVCVWWGRWGDTLLQCYWDDNGDRSTLIYNVATFDVVF